MTTAITPARRVALLGAVGLLAMAALAPTGISAVTTYATVDGYADGDSAKNNETYWEDLYSTSCTKVNGGAFYEYYVNQAHAVVIVKAGSDQSTTYPNTIFENVAAGETVWSDNDGSSEDDNDGPVDPDKTISHIILCGPTGSPAPSVSVAPSSSPSVAPSSSPSIAPSSSPSVSPSATPEPSATPSPTPTPTGGLEGETSEPTLPPTDSNATRAGGMEGLQVALMVIAGALAAVAVLTPQRVRRP